MANLKTVSGSSHLSAQYIAVNIIRFSLTVYKESAGNDFLCFQKCV